MEITITSESQKSRDVKNSLESDQWISREDVQFEMREAEHSRRAIDPTVLVAIVGAAGTSLGALLTGLLQVLKQTKSRQIVIQTKNGTRVEIPSDIAPNELDAIISKVRDLEAEKINIHIP